jgi:hypothetical protein
VIALGGDANALALVCDRVITMTGSILVGTPRVPVLADLAGDDQDGDDVMSVAGGHH